MKILLGNFLVWIFAFSMYSNFAIAQANVSDSINHVLSQLPDDRSRLEWCITQARKSPIPIAEHYIEKGKILAKKLEDRRGLANILSEEAILSNIRGAHQEGIRRFEQVDSLYRIVGDSIRIAGVNTNIGLSYFYTGAYDLALVHYFEAYNIYHRQKPSTGFSRLLNNLAICLKQTGNLEDSRKYYHESLLLKKTMQDSMGIATTQHNLGLLCSDLGQRDEAIFRLDSAISLYRKLDRFDDEASSLVALGKILKDHGQLERAMAYLQQGYAYFKSQGSNSYDYLLATGDLASIAMEQKQWEKAQLILTEALELARKTDKKEDLRKLLNQYAQVNSEMGYFRQALHAKEEATQLQDSLLEETKIELIEEMQTRFSVREKEKAVEFAQLALENEKKTSRLYRLGLGAAVLITILIAILGFFFYRARKILQVKNLQIETALRDKELLLKEIHHRVKNNLQIISSLLSMQSYQIQDPRALDAVREGKDRVRSMALIHQSLYQDINLVGVNSKEYIDKLVSSLFRSYNIDPDRIALSKQITAAKLDVDIMIPLGLILNELISNTLKYAFEDGRMGNVDIQLQKEEDSILLSVSDNGVGLPDKFKVSQIKSMGFQIVQDFCNKLNAALTVKSENGTRVHIRIPYPQNS